MPECKGARKDIELGIIHVCLFSGRTDEERAEKAKKFVEERYGKEGQSPKWYYVEQGRYATGITRAFRQEDQRKKGWERVLYCEQGKRERKAEAEEGKAETDTETDT